MVCFQGQQQSFSDGEVPERLSTEVCFYNPCWALLGSIYRDTQGNEDWSQEKPILSWQDKRYYKEAVGGIVVGYLE